MVHKKVAALRPLLRSVQVLAIVLAGLDLVLLGMRLAGWLHPGQTLDARLYSGAVSVALLVMVLAVTRRLDRALAEAEAAAQRQQEAFDALDAGIVLFDNQRGIVLCNKHFHRHYAGLGAAAEPGATYEQLLRGAVAAGMVPDAAGHEDAWITQRLSEFGRGGTGLMRRLPDGKWWRIVEQPLPDGGVLAHIVDVSELAGKEQALQQAQHELDRARRQLEDAIEALPAGFELYDADDRLVMVNSTNLQMYPQLGALVDKRPTFAEVVRANAAHGGLPMLSTPHELDAWIARRQRERSDPSGACVHRISDSRWVRVHERRTRDGGLVAIRLDVSELMQRESELMEMSRQLAQANQALSVLSHTDALTGLANRRAFDLRLTEEVSHALQHGMPLSLLLVDIDHFKHYNDRYGHPAGDECLRRVSAVLRDNAGRPTDLVARLGGEEFALLLPHQSAATALAFAQRCVRAVLAAAIEHAASPSAAVVTISIGVADLAHCGKRDPAALLAAADAALYQAKQQGRNRAVAVA